MIALSLTLLVPSSQRHIQRFLHTLAEHLRVDHLFLGDFAIVTVLATAYYIALHCTCAVFCTTASSPVQRRTVHYSSRTVRGEGLDLEPLGTSDLRNFICALSNFSCVSTTVTGRPESWRKERNSSMDATNSSKWPSSGSESSLLRSSHHIKWSAGNTSVTPTVPFGSAASSSAEAIYQATPLNKCSAPTAGNKRKNGSHSVMFNSLENK